MNIIKRTILVVDDTQANIDAAKAYFANNSDFDFVYAMNRKNAEELLPTVEGLITDRSIPFDENDTERQSEGHLLFLLAKAFGKEAVMVTGHGDMLGIGGVKNVGELDENTMKVICEEAKSFMGKPFMKESTPGRYNSIESAFSRKFGDLFDWTDGIDKTSERAWRLGSEAILKKMMLDEKPKPVEIKPFKMQ